MGLDYRTYREVTDALISFDGWLGEHLESLRRNPGDNLLSQLVALDDGEACVLSEMESRSTAVLVPAAVFETRITLIPNGTRLQEGHAGEYGYERKRAVKGKKGSECCKHIW